MKSKKRLLKESHLYIIIDKKICGRRSVIGIAKIIKDAGCDIIQFRDKESAKELILKNATVLRRLLTKTNNIFIINDYLDIAKIADVGGIHLGQDDSSLQIARKILGKNKIIGISCHNLKEAIRAQEQGADYISIGPIFSTSLKPQYQAIGLDLLRECRKRIKIPFFAIGGINKNNITEVQSGGGKRIAICRGILKERDISLATKNFLKILK